VEWEHTTREQIFQAVSRCIGRAMSNSAGTWVTDQAFLDLGTCVSVYARGLYALGQTEAGVVALVFEAAKRACDPDALHPAIVALLDDWCREAHLSCADAPGALPETSMDRGNEGDWSKRP
jgi:hypothetical protein